SSCAYFTRTRDLDPRPPRQSMQRSTHISPLVSPSLRQSLMHSSSGETGFVTEGANTALSSFGAVAQPATASSIAHSTKRSMQPPLLTTCPTPATVVPLYFYALKWSGASDFFTPLVPNAPCRQPARGHRARGNLACSLRS